MPEEFCAKAIALADQARLKHVEYESSRLCRASLRKLAPVSMTPSQVVEQWLSKIEQPEYAQPCPYVRETLL
jgi:hypothetical protein